MAIPCERLDHRDVPRIIERFGELASLVVERVQHVGKRTDRGEVQRADGERFEQQRGIARRPCSGNRLGT